MKISGIAKEWRGRVYTYQDSDGDCEWHLLLTCTFMAFGEDDARIQTLFYCLKHCEQTGYGPKMVNLVVEEVIKNDGA